MFCLKDFKRATERYSNHPQITNYKFFPVKVQIIDTSLISLKEKSNWEMEKSKERCDTLPFLRVGSGGGGGCRLFCIFKISSSPNRHSLTNPECLVYEAGVVM